jgi:hypothetical protein
MIAEWRSSTEGPRAAEGSPTDLGRGYRRVERVSVDDRLPLQRFVEEGEDSSAVFVRV